MILRTKIIISAILVGTVVGGGITGYKISEDRKLEHYRHEERLVQDQISKLILGDKEQEYTNLLSEYNNALEEKDFKKVNAINNKIEEFIINLGNANLLDLDNKLEAFKQLDISKLDDNTKADIEIKIQLIEILKANKDFKTANSEIDNIISTTKDSIQAVLDEEKKKEEELRKEEELKQDEQEKLENSNSANSGESGNSEDNPNNSSESTQDNSSANKYPRGSVEGLVASSPTAQYTDQIIGVVASGSSAQVYLLEKNNDTWEMILQTNGFVGSQGVGQASEYVSKTPKGSYSLGFAFGTGSNPGAKLSYRQITNDSYWISDVNSPLYNTWQEGDYGGGVNEHLIDYSTQYQYGITLNYNGGVGGGSAFFLHCSNGITTAGCISVPTNTMLTLIQRIHSGAHIINVNSVDELENY